MKPLGSVGPSCQLAALGAFWWLDLKPAGSAFELRRVAMLVRFLAHVIAACWADKSHTYLALAIANGPFFFTGLNTAACPSTWPIVPAS